MNREPQTMAPTFGIYITRVGAWGFRKKNRVIHFDIKTQIKTLRKPKLNKNIDLAQESGFQVSGSNFPNDSLNLGQ